MADVDDFINEYQSEHTSWASNPLSSGDIEKPSEDKIKSGWAIEQPKHSVFNWYMNRTDERLRKLEARLAYYEQHNGLN